MLTTVLLLALCFATNVVQGATADSRGNTFARYELTNWTVHSLPSFPRAPVQIPGHVTLDAFPAINPYSGSAEVELSTFSLLAWTYETTIHWDLVAIRPNEVMQLYFEKLDTVATVSIDGEDLKNSRGEVVVDNYFIPHVFELRRPNGASSSVLVVKIKSSLLEARQRARRYSQDNQSYPHTVNYHVWSEPTHRNTLRKPASDFGWDWGPSFPGAGIPGKVFIEKGPRGLATIEHVTVGQQFMSHNDVMIQVNISIRRLPGPSSSLQRVSARFGFNDVVSDDIQPSDTTKTFRFRVRDAKLWHPRGSRLFDGKPFLYDLAVQIHSQTVAIKRIGLRRVSLGSPDSFAIRVNDEIVDAHGTNVVPFDAFPTRLNWTEMIPTIIQYASDLNTNVFRIWGGGYFPDDRFYEACDEEGFLIWQDLPWACALFPATDEFLSNAREETQVIVSQLQSHPSLVVWGGNNEVEAAFDWFPEVAKNRHQFEQDYLRLFVQTIGETVAKYAQGTAIYIDSSPSNGADSSGNKKWGDVTDPSIGDIHFYNYSMDCESMQDYPKALFVSEYGVQSLPSILPRYLNGEALSKVLDARQRHEFGFEQLETQAMAMFPAKSAPLADLPYEGRALLTQIMQGRCLNTAITAWRSHAANHGIILWQLNDIWPGVSWSLVEYDLSWKASAYVVSQAFQPLRITTLRRSSGRVAIVIQADSSMIGRRSYGYVTLREFSWSSPEGRQATYLFKTRLTGKDIDIGYFETDQGAQLSGVAFTDLHRETSIQIVDDWVTPANGFHDYDASVRRAVSWSASGCEVTLTSKGALPVPYVWLEVRTQSATTQNGRFSRNAFLLLPGQTKFVTFQVNPRAQDHRCNEFAQNLLVRTLDDALGFSHRTMILNPTVAEAMAV